jgi:hypothetical protein
MVRGVYAAAFAFTSNVADGDTVTIGDVVYRFKATTAQAYDVDIGADLDASVANLVLAINASGVGDGTDYHAGTLIHPDFSATYDAANDELDLAARYAGNGPNGAYLAATSPGANDISPAAAVAGSVAGATQGSGSLDAWLVDLMALNQINSEVLYELKTLTDAAD